MHVSLWPSVPPRSRVPARGGNPIILLPLHPAEAPRFASGSGLKLTHLPIRLAIRLVRESGQRKKSRPYSGRTQVQRETPMLCQWLVVHTQPDSSVPRLKYGRGAGIRARFFRLKPGLPRGLAHTDLFRPRSGPSGASTSPESGFAVSTEENILSREKRKMWLTFSYCVYL